MFSVSPADPDEPPGPSASARCPEECGTLSHTTAYRLPPSPLPSGGSPSAPGRTRNKPHPTSQGFLLPGHYSATNLQGRKWETVHKVADMKSGGGMCVLETLAGAIVSPCALRITALKPLSVMERRHLRGHEAPWTGAKACLIYLWKVKGQGGRSCLATTVTCSNGL